MTSTQYKIITTTVHHRSFEKNIIVLQPIHHPMDKRILELLTSHGTLVSPDIIEYISSKDEPEKYIQEIMKQFHEIPLYLTIDLLKAAEAKLDAKLMGTDKSSESTALVDQKSIMMQNQNIIQEEPDSDVNKNIKLRDIGFISEDVKPDELSMSEVKSEDPIAENKVIEIKSGLPGSKKPMASEYDGQLKILKDITGNSTTEGTLVDFTKYFQIRYKSLRKILQTQRREVIGAAEIARVRDQAGPVKFIGLINNVRTTKQGHIIIDLEDETDSISALINNTSPLLNMNYIYDEVVCVIGKLGKTDLVYVEDIIRPDVPITRKQNRSEQPLNCVFMADIHNGSKTFLHKPWDRYIKWLNGKYTINGTEEFLDKLKYIVVAGDIVDGIGIYPNQEKELEITDIYAQYEDLANKFHEIPDHIQLIVQPGNHDAVRPAEPQPTFPKEITELFSNNIQFIGNPCYFSIDGVDILAYHGRSMDDFVMQVPNMTYNKPIQIMKEMLVRRHLAPVYGQKTPIAPEHQDYLLIDKVPDIFVTGHIHKTAVDNYRDISLINASAWQAQTTYQKMMNFNPDPGKIIIADLQSRDLKIINFA